LLSNLAEEAGEETRVIMRMIERDGQSIFQTTDDDDEYNQAPAYVEAMASLVWPMICNVAPKQGVHHVQPFHKMMTFTPSVHRGGFCFFARHSFAL